MGSRIGRMMRAAMPLLAGAPMLGVAQQASATPYIHVAAVYEIVTPGGLPAGIEESCGGDGCDGWLSVIHDFTEDVTETASLSGSATFTNTAATPYSGGYPIYAYFSPFNPGGPEIGLSIDNASQAARFSSTVSGTIAFAYGMQSCSVPAKPGGPGFYFSAFTCGVGTPDLSDGDYFALPYLAPGGSVELDWSILITDSFSAVPEPSGLAVLGSALLALGSLRSRHFHENR